MIVILVPTLGRVDRLLDVLGNIDDATPEPHRTAFICEPHEEVATRAVVESVSQTNVAVIVNRRKGHHGAYNTALEDLSEDPSWSWWFHGADDLRFWPGWAKAALLRSSAAHVIGTNDLLSKRVASGRTATHYLVHRSYTADNLVPGVTHPHAYFEGYHHLYVETEFIDIAIERGLFSPALDSIVEHLHWWGGKAEMDSTYVNAESEKDTDRALYLERRAARGR